jgi:hypothetical protein
MKLPLPHRCTYCRHWSTDHKHGKRLNGTPVRFCRHADDCRRRIAKPFT